MTTHLNYLLARERIADFTRSAQRERLAQSGDSDRLRSRRRALIARLLVRRRILVAEPGLRERFTRAPTTRCGEDGFRP
jgi:hypothetical protein